MTDNSGVDITTMKRGECTPFFRFDADRKKESNAKKKKKKQVSTDDPPPVTGNVMYVLLPSKQLQERLREEKESNTQCKHAALTGV